MHADSETKKSLKYYNRIYVSVTQGLNHEGLN